MDGQYKVRKHSYQTLVKALLALLLATSPVLAAVPPRFLPADPTQILYSFEKNQYAALRDAPRESRANPEHAAELAAEYVLRAKRDGDARYYGFAEALLLPWMSRGESTIPMRLTWAYVQQHGHDFEAALQTLSTVLAQPQPPAEGYLLRATILASQGKLTLARQDCRGLVGRASALVTAACAAQTVTTMESVVRGREVLSQLLASDQSLPANGQNSAERAWALGVLAELEQRLGEQQRVEQLLQEAVFLVPRDAYLRGRYADLLLEQSRTEEVVSLVQANSADNGLLLRWALAVHGRQDSCDPCAALAARYKQMRRRGEQPHERDYAQYLLHIVGDTRAALEVAKQNWVAQKEIVDMRLLLELALAANQPAAADDVISWLEQNDFYDMGLSALRQRLALTKK